MNSKAILIIGAISAISVIGADKKRLREELAFIPVPELPAKAVQLIQSAPVADREATASIVIGEIVKKHPASAPTLVSAINKAVPDVTTVAARAAVKESPQSRESVAAVVNSSTVASGTVATAQGSAAPAQKVTARSEPARDALTPKEDPSGRGQANPGNGPSQGNVHVKNRPIRYQLPDPPRRPVNPPVRKQGGRNE